MRIRSRRKQVVGGPAPTYWTGLCSCGSESIMVMCTFDADMNMEMYELYGACSWCKHAYWISEPRKEHAHG